MAFTVIFSCLHSLFFFSICTLKRFCSFLSFFATTLKHAAAKPKHLHVFAITKAATGCHFLKLLLTKRINKRNVLTVFRLNNHTSLTPVYCSEVEMKDHFNLLIYSGNNGTNRAVEGTHTTHTHTETNCFLETRDHGSQSPSAPRSETTTRAATN